MMKLKILLILALLFLPGIVSATSNDSFTPDFQAGMKDLPPEIKVVLDRVINYGTVILVLCAIIFTIYHGILAHIDGERQNAMGRSNHITQVFTGIGVLLLVFTAIIMINYLFT